ncbi:MAG TPA: hypothetical protein VK698_39755 [Kofleriaceae bacterium]|nr:hypothetical protein [Kofleriaceae bacterium]
MRTRLIAALLLTACLPLSACGSDGKAARSASSSPTVDSSPTAGASDTSQDHKLGTSAETIGAPNPIEGPGGGVLEITPTSIVYVTAGTGEKPANGIFAVVAYKAKSTKPVAAAETAPIDGGGWKWLAPDGQAIDTLSGNVTNVTPDGFLGGGAIQPGTYEWGSAAFDLTTAQRGGTLIYVDGAGTAYRWTMPPSDAGPEVAKLKKALAR